MRYAETQKNNLRLIKSILFQKVLSAGKALAFITLPAKSKL
jgi:hypothetical protein